MLGFFSNVSIGAYSYVTEHGYVLNTEIGRYCSIGRECLINPQNHPMDRLVTSSIIYNDLEFGWYKSFPSLEPGPPHKRCSIGNDVWIGARAIILSGICIGHGAVIGAGAVVAKDVPPYAIVVGSPAKVVRYRFAEDIVSELLDLRPWEYDLQLWVESQAKTSNFSRDDLNLLRDSIHSGELPRLKTSKYRLTGVDNGWGLSKIS
jgi:acetyltransferase-like isoleucine patch superfamily enzyme